MMALLFQFRSEIFIEFSNTLTMVAMFSNCVRRSYLFVFDTSQRLIHDTVCFLSGTTYTSMNITSKSVIRFQMLKL